MNRIAFHSSSTPQLSLEDDLKLARLAGYHGVICTYPKVSTFLEKSNQKDLKRYARESGVAIFGVANIAVDLNALNEEVVTVIKRHARLVRAMKGNLVTITPVSGPPADKSPEEIVAHYAQNLGRLALAAAEYGVNLAVEPALPDPYLCRPVNLSFIISRSGRDNLGFVFDTFFFTKEGVLLEELETIEKSFFAVYLADVPDLKKLKNSDRLPVGEGILDFERILKVVHDANYRGVFTVKHCCDLNVKTKCRTILRQARENMNAYLDIMEYL